MKRIIYWASFVTMGAVMSSADITLVDWQLYAVLACAFVACITSELKV
jgi:hypothetical protein